MEEMRNGFVIRQNGTDKYPFQVYHPNFDGIFIDAFMTFMDAKTFCNEENAEDWAENLRK